MRNLETFGDFFVKVNEALVHEIVWILECHDQVVSQPVQLVVDVILDFKKVVLSLFWLFNVDLELDVRLIQEHLNLSLYLLLRRNLVLTHKVHHNQRWVLHQQRNFVFGGSIRVRIHVLEILKLLCLVDYLPAIGLHHIGQTFDVPLILPFSVSQSILHIVDGVCVHHFSVSYEVSFHNGVLKASFHYLLQDL